MAILKAVERVGYGAVINQVFIQETAHTDTLPEEIGFKALLFVTPLNQPCIIEQVLTSIQPQDFSNKEDSELKFAKLMMDSNELEIIQVVYKTQNKYQLEKFREKE